MAWEDDSVWEKSWWNTCQNTFGEEQKQLDYAPKMGLRVQWDSQGPYIDMEGKSVLDIGGGPVSLLLKCRNLGKSLVIDPCDYPAWTYQRYAEAGINFITIKAEDYVPSQVFDEVWIYNVLQHTEDPEKIVKNALAAGKIVRVFDWLEIGVAPGHPQNLTEEKMNSWYEGEGKAVKATRGKEYYGVFKGRHYKP